MPRCLLVIRRDYILRMIEEFIALISRLRALKHTQNSAAAAELLDSGFRNLIGRGADEVARLSETELLATLIQGESTAAVRDKVHVLTALLKEAAELAEAKGDTELGRALHLKGLHLLLNVLAEEDPGTLPEFVPRIETFTAALAQQPLPLGTTAMLMRHYERIGDFGKAEDQLYAMAEVAGPQAGLADFGIAFYQRIGKQTNAALNEGNLPREELVSGLRDWKQKMAEAPSHQ